MCEEGGPIGEHHARHPPPKQREGAPTPPRRTEAREANPIRGHVESGPSHEILLQRHIKKRENANAKIGRAGKERRDETDGEHKHGMVTIGLEGHMAQLATKLQLDIPESTKGGSVSNQRHQEPPQRHPLRRGPVNDLHGFGGEVHRLHDVAVQSYLHLLRTLEEGPPRRAIRGVWDPNTAKRPNASTKRRDLDRQRSTIAEQRRQFREQPLKRWDDTFLTDCHNK
jgi:hypothetical protein